MDLIARHFDYVLGPDQDPQLASLKAGKVISCVLELDSDAPFIMRSRAWRVKYDADGDQTGLNAILARWYGPDRQYTSQNLVRQSLLTPYGGQIGNPLPVQKEVYYPPQAEIRVDLKNDSASDITNVTLYFRGVKLYRPGAVKSYTYPDKFSLLPFTYTPTNQGNNGGMPIISVPVTTGRPGPFFTFKCRTDADFALQAIQGGFPFSSTPVNEVFITLKDEDEKPYSNAPVHIDILGGSSGNPGSFPSFLSAFTAPAVGGPNSPGLIYPEIYVPKNHLLYFNVQRDDGTYAEVQTVNLPLQFIGQKVFVK